MGAVKPSILPAAQRSDVSVRVAFPTERAEQYGAFVRFVVAVRVFEIPNVRNAPGDRAVLVRVNTNWNVEAVGECRDFIRDAIHVGVLENFDGVAASFAGFDREWIFQR